VSEPEEPKHPEQEPGEPPEPDRPIEDDGLEYEERSAEGARLRLRDLTRERDE
jgi:hypothetical protein